ncbi:hypothetical protein P3S67_001320 [Capsicum chacoense]
MAFPSRNASIGVVLIAILRHSNATSMYGFYLKASIFSKSIRGLLIVPKLTTYFSVVTGYTKKSHESFEYSLSRPLIHGSNFERINSHNFFGNDISVSRHLFKWMKEMAYADYYERALTNGVLSIQRGRDPGVMIYMLPLGRGVSKAQSYHNWGTQFDSFWCCYGTERELLQYIPSSLDWKSGQVSVSQKIEPVVSWDNRLRVTITISSTGHSSGPSSTLNLRIPIWTHSSCAKATLNGKYLSPPPSGLSGMA